MRKRVLCAVLTVLLVMAAGPPSEARTLSEAKTRRVASFTSVTRMYDTVTVDSDGRVELAKMLYGEDRSVGTDWLAMARKKAVVQVALNRMDVWELPLSKVLRKSQFMGYRKGNPVREDLLGVVNDVCDAWEREMRGGVNAERVLPREFLWFGGSTGVNRFRDSYEVSGEYYYFEEER